MHKIGSGCLILLTACLLTLICAVAVDVIDTEVKSDWATVIRKEFDPAHTVTTYVMVGKILTPQTRYVPDSYALVIQTEYNGQVTVSVDEDTYKRIGVGFKVYYTYKRGKILGIRWSENIALEKR